jgi:tRNA G18 (ribose-2'-O)-methylase SpoU
VVERVERADDPRINEYRHVGDPAWLVARRLFVAEGRLVVRRLLEGRRFPVHSILLTPAALGSLDDVIGGDVPVFVAAQDVLNDITGFKFHRGCLAMAHRLPADSSATVRAPFVNARLLLALEGVGNPDNVGGLFRVAAAFGVEGLLLDPASGDPLYRKAVRTSMGAVLELPFERLAPWPEALDRFRDGGFKILALTPQPNATAIGEFEPMPSSGLIVMVGAEGDGLTEAALVRADALVRIPTTAAVDSLNVTVAAGVALAQLSRMIGILR